MLNYIPERRGPFDSLTDKVTDLRIESRWTREGTELFTMIIEFENDEPIEMNLGYDKWVYFKGIKVPKSGTKIDEFIRSFHNQKIKIAFSLGNTDKEDTVITTPCLIGKVCTFSFKPIVINNPKDLNGNPLLDEKGKPIPKTIPAPLLEKVEGLSNLSIQIPQTKQTPEAVNRPGDTVSAIKEIVLALVQGLPEKFTYPAFKRALIIWANGAGSNLSDKDFYVREDRLHVLPVLEQLVVEGFLTKEGDIIYHKVLTKESAEGPGKELVEEPKKESTEEFAEGPGKESVEESKPGSKSKNQVKDSTNTLVQSEIISSSVDDLVQDLSGEK